MLALPPGSGGNEQDIMASRKNGKQFAAALPKSG
jgi:hypothetical protein